LQSEWTASKIRDKPIQTWQVEYFNIHYQCSMISQIDATLYYYVLYLSIIKY